MGIVKGGFLRFFQTFLYFISFCCAAIVLGIYSYFLSVQADRSYNIPTWQKAVEGLSGAATLYTIFAVILTCCLGGIAVFSIIAFILDILFAAAFVAIAVMTRDGTSCSGPIVNTPLGQGNVNSGAAGYTGTNDGDQDYTYQVKPYTACKLNTAAFAVSIVAIIFFIITAFMQLGLIRSHGREKRYGPGPSNGYTEGYGKRKFWQRRNKHVTKDAELGTTGTAVGSAPARTY